MPYCNCVWPLTKYDLLVAFCNDEFLLSDVNELNKVKDYVPDSVKEYVYKNKCSDFQSCTVFEDGADCVVMCEDKSIRVEFTTVSEIASGSLKRHIEKVEKRVVDVLIVYTPLVEPLYREMTKYGNVEVVDVFSLRNLCYFNFDILLVKINLRNAKKVSEKGKSYSVIVV